MPALRLTALRLTAFRSWAALDVPLLGQIVVIAGPNGAGKTNLLEAISLLTPGRGLRGAKPGDPARRDAQGRAPAWGVVASVLGPRGAVEIATGTTPEAPDRRVFRIDGTPVRTQAEVSAHIAAVWLTPQMDALFQETASGRRAFLDRLTWALEPHHAREIGAHDNAMAQRNRLLAEGRRDDRWLAALEDAMARHGVAATASRRSLVARLNALLQAGVLGDFPRARLGLSCPIAAALDEAPALAVEDRLRETLAAGRTVDAAAGGARAGAHKADLTLAQADTGLPADQCSTGERKALLVATVVGHAGLIAAARGFAPLLLLDEAAVHLDERRREALFAALSALPAQVFLTGTDLDIFGTLAPRAQGFVASPGDLAPAPGFAVA
ncbi:DNA replication/repair protein RecF [Humitalea sp. 24SJ18S-53]|uniref:DNA replication/repair protein RecF n=1 Tax=Humitalea sp. 24SJ18S-53 TaxID=3422307 RepID=UPI003D66B7B4